MTIIILRVLSLTPNARPRIYPDMRYLIPIIVALALTGCAFQPPVLKNGMSHAEADKEFRRVFPVPMTVAVQLLPDGTIRKMYLQKMGNIESYISVDWVGRTHEEERITNVVYWAY